MSMDFARAALAERRPAFFLSLAPTTSSYPQPDRRPSASETPARPRRASISSPTGLRVLKLSPVYYGEHIGQNKDDFYDVPASPEMPPSTFLSLAPTTSSSYPQMPSPSSPGSIAERRRSSSSVSSTTGFRVLKLGPVYWGEHDGDHKEDFHDIPSSP
ncbi:hypothetical protein ACQKWADRAFT_308761 [Trichoderma austrokoningii]